MRSTNYQNALAIGTSTLSFIAPKVCCWTAAVAAISGGSSYLAWVYPLRPYLFAIAFVSLGISFYNTYWKDERTTNSCNACIQTKTNFFQSKLWLWIVTVFVFVSFIIEYI